MYHELSVNEERFKADFEALSQIGATPGGGVHRPTFSQAHTAARAWFRRRALESGLEFRMDGAGNHSAILSCGSPNAPTLVLGSHLDSVPDGGRFDGALGVAAALEVLHSLKEAGVHLPVNLEAVDFTDEEGSLLNVFGSAAMVGSLTPEDFTKTHQEQGRLQEILASAGLSFEGILGACRPAESLAGYLELHIEQGSRLHTAGVQIGVVSGSAGMCTYQISFHGRADHSGTTSMSERCDAAQGAAEFIIASRQKVIADFSGCVANVVWQRTLPGAFNIVPQTAELGLEFRAADPGDFERLESALLSLAQEAARRHRLTLKSERLMHNLPMPTSLEVQESILQTASGLRLSTQLLPSGAWHDAMMFAPVCPTGMIFIPSQNGSHSRRESAEWQDCLNGANVLLRTALILADRPSKNSDH